MPISKPGPRTIIEARRPQPVSTPSTVKRHEARKPAGTFRKRLSVADIDAGLKAGKDWKV